MKSIKIFLASSEELTDDRNAFGNLVRRLDRIYESRGIRIELVEWEDLDAAYNIRRKQDEYNDKIKASDMFLAIFHTKAGKKTIEEFDVATEEFRKHASPKVYVYCKDIQPGEQETAELKEFKRKLFEEMGHYWSRYNNRDSMQLHFVMQLQLVEASGYVESLKVENGMVVLDGMPIAKMDNLQFAAGNEAYCKMNAELASLPELIKKARSRVEKYPDDEDLRDELQQKLDRYNSLKEEFAQLQKALFETARRIAIMQQERVSDMLRRAIEAFENGNLERANTILDEIAQEAEHHIEQLDQQRELIHQDIDVFMLQVKTVMADGSVPIDDRIKKTSSIYAKADEWAQKSALPDEKYEKLLSDYSDFFFKYAQYKKALDTTLRLLNICQRMYGTTHHSIASLYNNVGLIYGSWGELDKALKYCLKALGMFMEMRGINYHETASTYNNIAGFYSSKGKYTDALENHFKALYIYETILGMNHLSTATSYTNIGVAYCRNGEYNNALKYSLKGLEIRQNLLKEEHLDIANSYCNISSIYFYLRNYDKALEFIFKANSIHEKLLGENPNTATSYSITGSILICQKKYDKAYTFLHKALCIRQKCLGVNHFDTATSYSTISRFFESEGDYDKAWEFEIKALKIRKISLGEDHPDTALSYNNLGTICYEKGDYTKALDYHFKALSIREVLGINHPTTGVSYTNVGIVYYKQGDYTKALDYFLKVPSIYENSHGTHHPNVAQSYYNIGSVYEIMRDYDKAIEYYFKGLPILEKIFGANHPETIKVYNNIATVYLLMGRKEKAQEYRRKACNSSLSNK